MQVFLSKLIILIFFCTWLNIFVLLVKISNSIHQLNKGRSSKFREGSRVRQTPEEGRRTYRPKRCGNNNKDEDNSPKTLNDKNLSIKYSFLV